MTTTPSTPSTPNRVLDSFSGGSVVQLIRGRGDAGLDVIHLQDATVHVTDDGIAAVTGSDEWMWLFEDLESVLHSHDSSWTILSVPGVEEFGVSVSQDDVGRFRRALDAGRGPETPVEMSDVEPRVPAETVIDLDEAFAPPDVEADARADVAVDAVVPQPEPIRVDFDEWPGVAGPGAEAEVHPPPPLVSDAPTEPLSVVVTPPPVATPAATAELAGLEARSISAWFGTHHVLDRVSLEMRPGEVTALIGPSGCGKSTFLRILNRMHEMIPSASLAGEVLLDGADVYDPSRKLTDARRQIGMVFQKPNPFPAMSIYDNVIASFRLTGAKVSPSVKDDTVESCLTKAGLWTEVRDRLRQPGGSLSGGQQQRLCIARALAIRPRVLLMDEPCSALDPTSTRRIEQTIVELRAEVTIVIVTHNMQQAARVSNRCAFFLAEQGTPGVIVEHGDTEAMFHQPQDERTLAYVNGQFG